MSSEKLTMFIEVLVRERTELTSVIMNILNNPLQCQKKAPKLLEMKSPTRSDRLGGFKSEPWSPEIFAMEPRA